jgi:hypothetical protein
MFPGQLVAHWRSEALRLQDKAAKHNDRESMVLVSRWITHSLTLLTCADQLEQSLKEFGGR